MLKFIIMTILPFLISANIKEFEMPFSPAEKFLLGNDVLISALGSMKSKRFALLTNQTGVLQNRTHIVDALVDKGANVVKIFSPEHGIRGDENYSSVDEKTGIPIISLYGSKYKPDSTDLEDVDVIIYDIQDVGARFYTYTSTLYYVIEAAVENKKQIIICDRPLIVNPDYVDGPMLEPEFESFVGRIEMPVCYGMTCGELGNFINGVYFGSSPYVEVFKMSGYTRDTDYDSLNLPWIRPSPNMVTSSTAVCYPATCFLEGTNVSEGRGSAKPFEFFGAPWMDSDLLAGELNSYRFEGVDFEAVTFTPDLKLSNYPPKFLGQLCHGIYINVTDKKKFEPVKCAAAILVSLHKLFMDFEFDGKNFIDKLAGSDKLRKMVLRSAGYESIINDWSPSLDKFKETREKYILYK